ncbi:hypothetical protein TNCV_2608361 [Trichonephila clavipes]|uniref:Uncharacterized protein n=1 Tax=Trichonephila clavipes TaxID=2585209 RepID=A0A8X6S723_TRICX|nr:hypothetical protein TNCV_2608361 [Trichonephila clavipes]
MKENCQILRQVGLLDVRLSWAVALSTIQVTVLFSSVPSRFRGRTPWEGQGPSTNLTRGLVARWQFRVPPCCKGTAHLHKFMCSLGFEPTLYSTAFSVSNHYTGWATAFSVRDKYLPKKLYRMYSVPSK